MLTKFELLLKHHRLLKNASVIKTNQINGSELAIWVKKVFKKPLLARCGYLHSKFIEKQTTNEAMILEAYKMESRAFNEANIGIVTSSRDLDWVVETHGVSEKKMRVIPNFVDTRIFKPSKNRGDIQYDLIYIGRSGKQKNLLELLNAIAQLKSFGQNNCLLLIGDCASDEQLRDKAKEESLDVTFIDNLPNYELPSYLSKASVFILPSLYEGHPKALIEAMAFGMPCIGTDVEGIREDISHMKTGYLCGADSKSIADAIRTVISDDALKSRLGQAAREYIVDHYSLEKIVEMELKAIEEVLGEKIDN